MSLKMNRESMVLLKNEGNLLPLDKSKYEKYTGDRPAGCRK
jgi:beta-glucosidase